MKKLLVIYAIIFSSCSFEKELQGEIVVLTLVNIEPITRRNAHMELFNQSLLYWSNNEGITITTYDSWPSNHKLWETMPYIMRR